MPILHVAAHTRWMEKPFLRRDACADMWSRLRRRFKQVLGCILMPDHLHLLLSVKDIAWFQAVMAKELSAFAQRWARGKNLWLPMKEPRIIPDLKQLKRQIRYTHLNPCRSGLARDPLEWEWSTHRDALGAAVPNWLDMNALKQMFGAKEFEKTFHSYVSSDPTVDVAGTALPRAWERGQGSASFAAIELAALQATRSPNDSLSRPTHARRLMLLAAQEIGNPRQSELAAWIGTTERAVRYVLAKPTTEEERAALNSMQLLLANPQRFDTTSFPKSGNFRRPA